jgi:hypothetical protein
LYSADDEGEITKPGVAKSKFLVSVFSVRIAKNDAPVNNHTVPVHIFFLQIAANKIKTFTNMALKTGR